MQTMIGLWYFLVAGVMFALLGIVCHVSRAVFNFLPDRLSDKPMMDLVVSDGYNLSDMLFGTEYDDAGYYKLDSLRNLIVTMLLTVAGGWGAMFVSPQVATIIASFIDWFFTWAWELFLYRLREARWW